jgi:hypothetical protein
MVLTGLSCIFKVTEFLNFRNHTIIRASESQAAIPLIFMIDTDIILRL